DIDPVTKEIIVIDDHVAQIDADTELDPSGRWDIGVAPRHAPLDLGGANDGIDDALELYQHAVAGRLDDTSAVLCNGRIDKLNPMRLEASERSRLIDLHQPAVADHVSGEHRGKPAFRSEFDHPSDPFAGNSSRSEPALHLYAPPWQSDKSFRPTLGRPRPHAPATAAGSA